MNPAARQVALLDAQAAAWEAAPPAERVLVAGTTGGIPAVARLLRVVAATAERRGGAARPGHRRWPRRPGRSWTTPIRRPGWPGCCTGWAPRGTTSVRGRQCALTRAPRHAVATLSRALLPAEALGGMAEARARRRSMACRCLSPADQQEEAAAIAMVLREALETPGATAALVTPDRDLAGRVATELLRYGVVADDSAGETLADTPPAVFLRLLARAVADELAPVPLLALLKHPLAAAGLAPAACRAAARALELACLRGPRPRPGVTGLRRALDRARAEPAANALLERLEALPGTGAADRRARSRWRRRRRWPR